MPTIGPRSNGDQNPREQRLNSSWVRRLFGTRELSCDDIVELSSDYVDDEISGSVARRFRRHIDDCTDCNTFVATFRATVMTLRDIPRLAASADLRARVKECIEAEAAQADAPSSS